MESFERKTAWLISFVALFFIFGCGKSKIIDPESSVGPGVGVPDYVLTVNSSGKSGEVDATWGNKMMACVNEPCHLDIDKNASVLLHPVQTVAGGGGNAFTGWSGGVCSGIGDCSFKLNQDQAVTAGFALSGTVYVSFTSSSGSHPTGTVSFSPNFAESPACSTSPSSPNPGCSIIVPAGVAITLTATAGTFGGWTGCSGTGPSCTVTVSGGGIVNVEAQFN